MKLTQAQTAAIAHVRNHARRRRAKVRRSIEEVLQMSDLSWDDYADALDKIKRHARVGLHFHPDRPNRNNRPVAGMLLEEGIYRSQFETQLSNGSVTAYPGGDRDLWEIRLFGGAYHHEEVPHGERPKYGALDLMGHPDGPSPRFGSCYFLLSPEASSRSTFTYLDSHLGGGQRGTLEQADGIMAALLGDAFLNDSAIGEKKLSPRRLIHHLRTALGQPFRDPSGRRAVRNLNHYIEAQVHGDVSLADDADILVADPAFKATSTGETLAGICSKYSIKLFWHMGFIMRADEVPSDFRGPAMPSLAKRVAHDGLLDAAAIGTAATELRLDPASWADRGDYAVVLQELKLLWHVLVRYGRPRREID